MSRAFLNLASIQTAIFGSTLLMGFMMVNLLSTRMKWVVKIFGGLEGTYFWHRILAIGTTALIFLHQTIAVGTGLINNINLAIVGSPSNAGELSRNIFILLILFALLAKMFKYEHFRLIHRFLIIPYLFGIYHGFFSSWVNLFSFDTLSIWMITTT